MLIRTVFEEAIHIVKRKPKEVGKDQKTLALITKENISIVDVMKLKLAKNRVNEAQVNRGRDLHGSGEENQLVAALAYPDEPIFEDISLRRDISTI